MTEIHYQNEHLKIIYDFETRIGTVAYEATLTPQITAEAYEKMVEWLVSGEIPLQEIYGMIFDFRKVERFEQGNFQAVKREHKKVSEGKDFSHVPTALMVSNFYQEEMVRISSKITAQEKRVRILYSDEQVQPFFAEFHRKRTEEMQPSTNE